ncbi:MAG: hypothetical protein PVH38_02315 [Gammaproteobacteria bacterium]|jgi:hypothetical protein
MAKEQRIGVPPVPDNLEETLNEAQIFTLKRMENYGWELKFIRRPLFQDVLPVLYHVDSNEIGVLEDDGSVNMQRDINVRD